MEEARSAAVLPEPLALESLIDRGRRGDRQALRLLIEGYQLRVAKFVLGQTNDANAFEDVSQAIFVKMVQALPRLRDPTRFEGWLFQIARNACRDHLRAQLGWRRHFVPYEEAAHDRIPAAGPEEAETSVEHGLAQLAPEDRALLEAMIGEKPSQRELASRANTTVSAVKSRLYRARRELRALLAADNSK